MAPPPRPPPALVDELVEEILLRIPPDDPAGLVRATLACKRWRRIVSGRPAPASAAGSLSSTVRPPCSASSATSQVASARLPGYNQINLGPTALVGRSLYFTIWRSKRLLKYDLATRQVSVIPLPTECFSTSVVPMTTEDGRLGFAHIANNRLCLWSREAAPGEGAGWAQRRVVELQTLLPRAALSSPLDIAGFADAVSIVFVLANETIFTIDLKSCQVTKVCKDGSYSGIFPCLSFCTPALAAASTVEGPRANA
ncbi:unnamed protein product [Urochloa decumbens]|uniref:F-box domain-containing protein n=1 Tax=Urochloa decumbens TaxID=240449 RepID=A0ABC9DA56_9POAL